VRAFARRDDEISVAAFAAAPDARVLIAGDGIADPQTVRVIPREVARLFGQLKIGVGLYWDCRDWLVHYPGGQSIGRAPPLPELTTCEGTNSHICGPSYEGRALGLVQNS
jgi:hypothetical protein